MNTLVIIFARRNHSATCHFSWEYYVLLFSVIDLKTCITAIKILYFMNKGISIQYFFSFKEKRFLILKFCICFIFVMIFAIIIDENIICHGKIFNNKRRLLTLNEGITASLVEILCYPFSYFSCMQQYNQQYSDCIVNIKKLNNFL